MAKVLPKIFYGLHMNEGVAQYDNDTGSEMLFVGEETIKKMNASFAGRPVYVGHRDVNLENIQNEADGYVVESFYNKADGKSWVKFIVVSDAGQEAIQKGWRLSNSYIVKNSGLGGKWHNIDYNAEVVEGEYNHLAIVENPRYDESIIFSPEQFKEYNERKENELKKLENSIKEKKPMGIMEKLKEFIKSNEVEVEIKPEEKKEEKLEKEEKKEEPKENEEDKKFKVGEEEVSLKDLKNSWIKNKKKNEEDPKEEKKKEEKENEEDKEEDDKKLNEIKNAVFKEGVDVFVETTMSKLARGNTLYGSKK